MKKPRADKKVTRGQVQRSACALLDKDLYNPTDEEYASFRSENGAQDPRFSIDRLFIDEKGMITQHPYGASMSEMKALIEWCEEHGYDFFVTGRSEYFPGTTFKITFSKALLDPDTKNNGSG